MVDFESALNDILSSPEQMERIMGLARSLSGGETATPNGENAQKPSASAFPFQDPGGIDPKMLGILTKIMGEVSSQGGEKAALIAAMKPFLRQDRYESLNKALTITKIARAARTAMTEMGGDKLV